MNGCGRFSRERESPTTTRNDMNIMPQERTTFRRRFRPVSDVVIRRETQKGRQAGPEGGRGASGRGRSGAEKEEKNGAGGGGGGGGCGVAVVVGSGGGGARRSEVCQITEVRDINDS